MYIHIYILGESILVCHKSKSIFQIRGENNSNDYETDDARKLFVTLLAVFSELKDLILIP